MKKSILFLVLLQSLLIFAQAPQKMTYQSVVRNSANVLLANQAVGVRISILEGTASGAAVYSETHTVTTNANGLFTLEAGGGTPTEGVFADIVWGNGAHYIKSEIDPAGGTNYTLSATKELLSVPYALYAVNGITTAQADAITAQAATIAALQAQIEVLQKPQLSPTSILDFEDISAVYHGMITNPGLGDITERGVVWSTLPNPTIALSTKTYDGAGSGEFGSNITGLTSATTYYMRTYATNSAGTAYGTEVSFTTFALGVSRSINIGTQTWMAKNLDVATYNDGTPIPQVTDPSAWVNLTTGAWCYNNNDPANGTKYRKLYNWYAVAGIHDNDPNTPNKTFAPIGWHVPTDGEWTTLADYLGGANVAGGKMKAIADWISPNSLSANEAAEIATNSSGFTGLPGGSRSNGYFGGIGTSSTWWSSSESYPDTRDV